MILHEQSIGNDEENPINAWVEEEGYTEDIIVIHQKHDWGNDVIYLYRHEAIELIKYLTERTK